MKKEKLYDYFTKGLNPIFRGWIGAEIETHFIYPNGDPITIDCSQEIFKILVNDGWQVVSMKGVLITELAKNGAKILYELGRQNIEVATPPADPECLFGVINSFMSELYFAAEKCNAYPLFAPIIETEEDLLIIPDERDAAWLELDGVRQLGLLSKISSVQFTFETKGPEDAIYLLNKLSENRDKFVSSNPYVQEEMWVEYIQSSKAGYRSDRYGVMCPTSIGNYVELLSSHDVVLDSKLVPFDEAEQENIDMFLRSVWWNFRLRRYSDRLCIEVRTLSRRDDGQILCDFNNLLSIIH